MHSLLKPLLHLLEPLSLLLFGLVILTGLLWWRRQRGLAWFSTVLVLLFAVVSCTAISDRLLAGIEREWAATPKLWDTLPVCDAIVCLGGGTNPNPDEISGVDMQEDSDRIITAVELVHRGRAPFLMLGGGYAMSQKKVKVSESMAVRAWLQRWQAVSVPMDDLGICSNTRDEAVAFAEKAKQHGWKKVILVTSASHMHRAAGVFRKTTGLEVIPVPCAFRTDVESKDRPLEWVFMPSTHAIDLFGVWLYETLGWWTYKVRGWV